MATYRGQSMSMWACLGDEWSPVGWWRGRRLTRALRQSIITDNTAKLKTVAFNSFEDLVLFKVGAGWQLAHISYLESGEVSPSDCGYYESEAELAESFALEAQAKRQAELFQPECPQCGALWYANESKQDCRTCGGYSMLRPCPMCGGQCGAIWDRAYQDSIDSGEAVWVGHCQLKD